MGPTRDRSVLNNGFKYSADWTCVAAANLPCVDRFMCSEGTSVHDTYKAKTVFNAPGLSSIASAHSFSVLFSA